MTAERDRLVRALQGPKQHADQELQRAVERVAAKEAAETRGRERAALDRVGRAERAVGSLHGQLGGGQAVAAEPSKLAQELQDLRQHTARALHRATDHAAHKDAEALAAGESERGALDRRPGRRMRCAND